MCVSPKHCTAIFYFITYMQCNSTSIFIKTQCCTVTVDIICVFWQGIALGYWTFRLYFRQNRILYSRIWHATCNMYCTLAFDMQHATCIVVWHLTCSMRHVLYSGIWHVLPVFTKTLHSSRIFNIPGAHSAKDCILHWRLTCTVHSLYCTPIFNIAGSLSYYIVL